MSDNARWKLFCFVGLTGMALAFYVLDNVMQSEYVKNDLLSLCVFGATAVTFIAASAINFYLAFAFKFGRVDEVVGSMHSAVLIQGGRTMREGSRIQLKRDDPENASLTDDQRNVLFICDWRPWVCSLRTFRCTDDRDASNNDG